MGFCMPIVTHLGKIPWTIFLTFHLFEPKKSICKEEGLKIKKDISHNLRLMHSLPIPDINNQIIISLKNKKPTTPTSLQLGACRIV
jgi:hypothetical protein